MIKKYSQIFFAIISISYEFSICVYPVCKDGPLAKAEIMVDMIIQNTRSGVETDLTFTVTEDDFERAKEISETVAKEIGAEEVLTATEIAKVSVIGLGMKSHSGVAAIMFEALASENINIRLISTSEIRISWVILSKYAELAVRTLHTAFGLDQEKKTPSFTIDPEGYPSGSIVRT